MGVCDCPCCTCIYVACLCTQVCLRATAPATLHVSSHTCPHTVHMCAYQGCMSHALRTSVGDSACVYRVYKPFMCGGGVFDSRVFACACTHPAHVPYMTVPAAPCVCACVCMQRTCTCSAGSSSHCNPCSFSWLSGPDLPLDPEQGFKLKSLLRELEKQHCLPASPAFQIASVI